VPRVLFNVYGADFRLPWVIAIVTLGAVSPGARLNRAAAMSAFAVAMALVVARSADAFTMLRRLDVQVAEVRAVLAHMPVGQRLLVVQDALPAPGRVAPPPMTGHFGLLATLDRDAFVPYFFFGWTPVALKPSMERSASLGSMPLTFAQLQEGLEQPEPAGNLPPFYYGGQKYWLGWPKKYDYVLVVHFGRHEDAIPPVLQLVQAGAVADLYKVEPK
jgi:hypothetical protein